MAIFKGRPGGVLWIDPELVDVTGLGRDEVPDARVADIEKATNYIRQGLGELLAGKPVSTATSQAYGCSIKYKRSGA